MKAKNVILVLLVALFFACAALCAETKSDDTRPYMGVLLDPAPLPDLLIKHLGLLPDQGIRIKNVQRGSPADKTGLERDDIIVGFEGQDVDDYEGFVDAVREAGSGTEVSLEIIHLGIRKIVKLKLVPFDGEFDWKYPPEPEIVQSWRPGKMFRLKPGDEDWMEVILERVPPKIRADIDKFFKEVHVYHHSDGESYTITIEGDPDDEDATITVCSGETEYRTTAADIDKLPEKYREAAEQALKNARRSPGEKRLRGRLTLPYRRYDFEMPRPERGLPLPPFGPGEEMFDKIQKQMRELQERIEELEKRGRKALEQKSQQPEKDDKQRT